jgi:DNA-binding transcriptional ArsR family regulator
MSSAKEKIDRVFQALGDPTRRAIVERLAKGPSTVSRLAAPLEITITAVGQHLQVLEESGFVRTEKVGRARLCSLEAAGFKVLSEWIAQQRSLWDRKLDRLGKLLEEDE